MLAERALAAARLLATQHREVSRPQISLPVNRMAPELTGRTGLLGAVRRGKSAAFTVGDRDFPPRLSPTHLVGREAEIEQLASAVDAAVRGECRVVLICGAAGIGKSSLVNELRPLAAVRNGRFV